MRKLGQNQKNWAILTPRSSTTVRHRKKLIDLGNSLAIRLQRGVNSISLRCIPWLVACSEWGACLSDLTCWGFRSKWPVKWNVFQDSSTGHRITFCGQIWWKPAAAKLPKGNLVYLKKTWAPQDSSEPPFCHTPKIPRQLSPLDLST